MYSSCHTVLMFDDNVDNSLKKFNFQKTNKQKHDRNAKYPEVFVSAVELIDNKFDVLISKTN